LSYGAAERKIRRKVAENKSFRKISR